MRVAASMGVCGGGCHGSRGCGAVAGGGGGGCCCVVVGIKVVKVVKYVKDVVELLCVEAILRGGISRVGEVGGRASECNALDNWLLLLLLCWRWLGCSGVEW